MTDTISTALVYVHPANNTNNTRTQICTTSKCTRVSTNSQQASMPIQSKGTVEAVHPHPLGPLPRHPAMTGTGMPTTLTGTTATEMGSTRTLKLKRIKEY